jgi:DNA-binding beta-propeller fold protein YncE
MFVADALAHQVLVLDASGATARAIGAFGVDAASLNGPRSVAIDPLGRVLVADGGNRRVQVYSPAGEHLDTWRTPDLVAPRCVRIFGDTVLVADSVAGLVHAFDLGGRPLAPVRPTDAAGRAAAPVWLSTADGALILTVRPGAPA